MALPELFQVSKPVIGMLHVPALPGSPAHAKSFGEICHWVLADGAALAENGVHGLLLENFGDAPFYPRRVPPHTVAFLAVLGREVKAKFALPLGINVLRNDAGSALAIATAVEAVFLRVNVYTGARLTDQGIIQGQAHRLLRYRKLLESRVRVFADVAVKHSAPLGTRDLGEEVEDTVSRGLADAIIVSGSATGRPGNLEDLAIAKQAARATPVLAGSGVSLANVEEVLTIADGVIVGSAFKKDGQVDNPVDGSRVREFMAAARG